MYRLFASCAQIGTIAAILFLCCTPGHETPSPTGPDDPVPTPPSAGFTYNTTITDSSLLVTFTNSSTNATEYLWSFGDGRFSTDSNPSHSYDSIGYYDVQLKAIGAAGKDSHSVTILLDRAPSAAFSVSVSSTRAPLVVSTTNSSLGARTYAWEAIDMESLSLTVDSTLVSSAFEPEFMIRSWGSWAIRLIASSIQLTDTAYRFLDISRPNDMYLDSVVVTQYPKADTLGNNWDLQYFGDLYFLIWDKDNTIMLRDSSNRQTQFSDTASHVLFLFSSFKLGSVDEYYYLSLYDYDNGEWVSGNQKDEDYTDDFIATLTVDVSTYLARRELPASLPLDLSYNATYRIVAEVFISYR